MVILRDLRPSRREAIVGAGAAVATMSAPGLARAQSASIAGVVYDLALGSATGGLQGVLVSNGREVVATDALGRYTLPLPDEATIFVIKPSGYMPPVDSETQLPRFYRVHQPKGTPTGLAMAHAGLSPTPALPASLDFPLRRQEEPDTFEVVLLTDPQPQSDAEIDFIREDIADALAGTSARFGITAGDIMFDDLSLYERYNRIIGSVGIPWWNIGGNHDLNYEAPGRRYSRETFKRVFGPPYYAFEYGRAIFLMIDDVDYLGADPSQPRMPGRYEGRIDPAQLEFLKNVIDKTPRDRLIVLIMHIPLRTYVATEDASATLANRSDLFALLQDRRHCVSFAGHTHTTEHHYFGPEDGWSGQQPHHHHVLTALSGSWWSGPYDRRGVACADSRDGSPNGLHILSIDGVSYRTRFIPAKEPNGRQVRLTIDDRFDRDAPPIDRETRAGRSLAAPISQVTLGAARLVANVFDGGPRTKVYMTIDDGAAIEMTREFIPDPFIVDVFAQNASTKKAWVCAEACSHIWTTKLPSTLPVGAHRVLVSGRNEYGEAFSGRLTLEVVG